jgi:hypothetical protein
MVGLDEFGAAVQATVSGKDITSYGLGLGVGAGVPEPASIALLLAGGVILGFIALRK